VEEGQRKKESITNLLVKGRKKKLRPPGVFIYLLRDLAKHRRGPFHEDAIRKQRGKRERGRGYEKSSHLRRNKGKKGR